MKIFYPDTVRKPLPPYTGNKVYLSFLKTLIFPLTKDIQKTYNEYTLSEKTILKEIENE